MGAVIQEQVPPTPKALTPQEIKAHGPEMIHIARFYLFCGVLVDESCSDDEIDAAAAHSIGFMSFHSCAENPAVLLTYARNAFDPDEVWWHIVDMIQRKIVYHYEDPPGLH